jgi:hypothetical protein
LHSNKELPSNTIPGQDLSCPLSLNSEMRQLAVMHHTINMDSTIGESIIYFSCL